MADQRSKELRVTVLGGGSWGTTVAHLAAHNTPTRLWARDDATVDAINAQHRNLRYLPDHDLHPRLEASSDFDDLVANTDLLVMGIPTSAFRETCQRAAASLRPWVPVISLAKGFEVGTNKRMTEIITEELPSRPVGVLTGPNLAKEILAGGPAAAVIALTEHEIAQRLQQVFTTPTFRVFTNEDVVGCELGGALKNVYAVAAATVEGRGLGDNARAAIVTRGLAELIELGTALGGEPLTLAGLAGMGDLFATCVSPQSRNSFVGRRLGQGVPIEEILAEMNQVAEGVKATRAAIELAADLGITMPIAGHLAKVCFEGRDPNWAEDNLLRGKLGHE
ncbi:MAG: NAD(P)-dependent glycerol-3-phosphate dehydrogenase [Acidimicrobiia bacterium]|nr:NAD(P)-dependent glycerol-3-phosphate dehydrogenase [Acidimicrobiia bacterium]